MIMCQPKPGARTCAVIPCAFLITPNSQNVLVVKCENPITALAKNYLNMLKITRAGSYIHVIVYFCVVAASFLPMQRYYFTDLA
jgi:hypothetical protein